MADVEKPARILVIDDELQMRRALRSILSARRYEVILATGGEEGLDLAAEWAPDLVILDLSMPGTGGLDVCRELRSWFKAPILVLSVHSETSEKVAALDLGADDYLTKPFASGELLARVRALLRRGSAAEPVEPLIQIGDLLVDVSCRRVSRAGVEIKLTRTEFEILAYLAGRAGRVVTAAMLLQAVWGPAYATDTQTLRVHVGHLRKKIEPHPAVPQYLITEPGVGFRLVER